MNIQAFRGQFPSLGKTIGDHQTVYLDGPAGSQVPQQVIDAISNYYIESNANTHGFFHNSMQTDSLISETRAKVATLLGAPSAKTISFGQNMTTLTYSLSKALLRRMHERDELIITQLDHEGNRGPWLALEESGIIVREVGLLPSGHLDYEDFHKKINDRTKMVCVGYASNLLGTVNDIARINELLDGRNIFLLIDAVHAAPHIVLDVESLDCDFLVCSAYKFYGPHVGILYSREGLLDSLETDRLCTQDAGSPYRIETGTLNHAAIAGVGAAIEFIASWGEGDSLRTKLVNGLTSIHDHEMELAQILYRGLSEIDGLDIYGPAISESPRTPTLSFTVENQNAADICTQLGKKGINAWDGHFYAKKAAEVLGIMEKGGAVRMGIMGYNTREEIDRTVQAVKGIVGSGKVGK